MHFCFKWTFLSFFTILYSGADDLAPQADGVDKASFSTIFPPADDGSISNPIAFGSGLTKTDGAQTNGGWGNFPGAMTSNDLESPLAGSQSKDGCRKADVDQQAQMLNSNRRVRRRECKNLAPSGDSTTRHEQNSNNDAPSPLDPMLPLFEIPYPPKIEPNSNLCNWEYSNIPVCHTGAGALTDPLGGLFILPLCHLCTFTQNVNSVSLRDEEKERRGERPCDE